MGGCCREMTLEEELENLDLDQHDRDRILRKYRDEQAYKVESHYREMENLNKVVNQQAVEIKALTGYIAMRDI